MPLRICSTAIIDPYSLQRFYREKEDDRQFQAETPEQILNYKEKYREFYISLYDKYKEGILIQLEEREKKEDQEKTDKEDKINAEERDLLDKKSSEAFKRLKQKEFKFFLNFLKFNGNFSYGNFLKKIIKDKDRYDYLHKEDLDKYSVFFDYNSINFLHSDEETRMKFSQFKTKKTTCYFSF